MYVVMGAGRKSVGDTPEEAVQAWLALGRRGPIRLIRTPAYVTRQNLDAALRSFHAAVPAGSGDDDSWVLVDRHDPLGAPSDLAEGPMMPRNLPGYAAGLAAGQFRPPPEQPPIPLPGVPGNVRNIAQYVVPVAVFAAIPLLRGFVPFPALGVGAVGSIIILGWWATRRLYAELDAGYVTRPTAQVWAGGRSSMKWSFRGIWVLTWSGRVKAEPERGLDAPGFYPSPARPGMLQLWTGVEWFPKFREPPAERP